MDLIQNYITDNIKKFYLKQLIAPVILLVLIIIINVNTSFSTLFFKTDLTNNMETIEEYNNKYVQFTFDTLFSTHEKVYYGRFCIGTYYYSFINNKCLFVLLPNYLSDNDTERLENITVSGKLLNEHSIRTSLIENMAAKLNWSTQGLDEVSYSHFLTASRFTTIPDYLLSFICFVSLIYSVYSIVISIVSIINPVLSPPVQRLRRYGNPKELLDEADIELSTLPQLATEDMFITEHYFIEISAYGIAIVPIKEMVWLYKHSTIEKRFGIHVNISYTLHISAKKSFYINCPKNIKSNIDGIIDYLAETNHDIIVGFNKENKRIARIRSKS